MGYPTQNIHRRSRRHLQIGQGPFPAGVTVTATGSGSTAILTFSRPVNISGNVGLTVATLTFVSQAINSPTQLTVTMSGAVATHAWNLPSNDPKISSYQGGPVLGASGTF